MKFFAQSGEKFICQLCDHYCNLKKDQIGICGVNKNTGTQIECLVYGYPNAINIDPIEKKPLQHFLPHTKTFSIGTVGCNFKCPFCQNWQLSQNHKIDRSKYFLPKDIVNLALDYSCESISYTYNEPTIFFPYIYDIAKLAHQNGLKNIMVSNGFQSREVCNQMIGLIDAVNVDLKTFNSSYYKKELGGKLEVVLDNLKFFVQNGIHTEITTLLIPTKNDSDDEIKQIASFIANHLGRNIPWHISAFHPDYKQLDLPKTSLESLKNTKNIGISFGLKNIYLGNVRIDDE